MKRFLAKSNMPKKKDGYKLDKLSKIEMKILSRLLENGHSIRQSLEVIRNKNNESTIEMIITLLDKGVSISKVFKMFDDHQYRNIAFFSGFLSIQDSINLAISINEEKEKILSNLFSQISYPLLTSFLSIILLIFFSFEILPMFNGVGIDSTSLLLISLITKGIMLIFILFFIFVIIYIAFHFVRYSKKDKYDFYQNVLYKVNIFKLGLSYIYSIYLQKLFSSGISTKHIFEILSYHTENELIAGISKKVIDNLNNGSSLIDAFSKLPIDLLLIDFIKFGIETNDISRSIREYQEIRQEQILHNIKIYARNIQIVTYTLIGIVVIIIYQAMLIPLDLINEL